MNKIIHRRRNLEDIVELNCARGYVGVGLFRGSISSPVLVHKWSYACTNTNFWRGKVFKSSVDWFCTEYIAFVVNTFVIL